MRLYLKVVLLLVVCAGSARGQDRVTVVKSEVKVVTRTFDPKKPPREMPALSPSEVAITNFQFSMEADADAPIVSKNQDFQRTNVEVRVDGVSLRPRLKVTIWLPIKASQKVIEHENGHRKIAEIFYGKVDVKGKEAGGAVIGKIFAGHGRNTDSARNDAIVKALKEVNAAILELQATGQKVQERYDRITDHSRKNVAVDEAIKQAVEEVERGAP
jgi:hypothetical protein